jgi:hypothetical protein
MTGFQLSLGGLSAEIKNLQSETLSLNVKLANRTELEGTLMQFTDSLNVTNDVIKYVFFCISFFVLLVCYTF